MRVRPSPIAIVLLVPEHPLQPPRRGDARLAAARFAFRVGLPAVHAVALESEPRGEDFHVGAAGEPLAAGAEDAAAFAEDAGEVGVRDVLDELEGEDFVEGGVAEREGAFEVGEEIDAGCGAEVGDDDAAAGSADDGGVGAGAAEEERHRRAGVGVAGGVLGLAAGEFLPEAHRSAPGIAAAIASMANLSRTRAGRALMATRARAGGQPRRE